MIEHNPQSVLFYELFEIPADDSRIGSTSALGGEHLSITAKSLKKFPCKSASGVDVRAVLTRLEAGPKHAPNPPAGLHNYNALPALADRDGRQQA